MRFLCFHGMGTNGRIFQIQTAKLRLAIGRDHEYVFVDGRVPKSPAPGAEQSAAADEEFLCYAHENDLETISTLHDDIYKLLEDEGPFDGVMGFSEGAALAASLVVDRMPCGPASQGSPMPFKCAIFFCAANPVDAEAVRQGRVRLLDVDTAGHALNLPTAHIWAREDPVHQGFGQVASMLAQEDVKEEYIHDLGHTIPGAQSDDGLFEATRAIRRTIDRAECANFSS